MTPSEAIAGASSSTLYSSWFDQFIGSGDKQSMLIGVAGIAVVVWTAGFVVRSFGHKPNRGLMAAMTYAQLSFMGGLVAAFLTPVALQCIALVFLLQEAWQIPNALYRRAKKPAERTFGDQQVIDFLGIESRLGLAQYLAFQTPYVAGILCILRWPTQFVAIPMAWVALYLSYQILLYFLFAPRENESAAPTVTPTSASPTAVLEPTSFVLLKGYQQQLGVLLETEAIVQKIFSGNVGPRIEAVLLLSQLNECTNMMSQWHASGGSQFTTFMGSAYFRTLIQHRIATDRLSLLLTNTPYPVSPGGEFELVMRAEKCEDHLMARYAVDTNGRLEVRVWNTESSTTISTEGVLVLGESYVETANGCLARLVAAIR